MRSPLDELRPRLADLMLRDERRLRRRLDQAHAVRDPVRRDALAADLQRDLAAAEARVARRRAGVPAVSYPPELPITDRKDEILAAIRDHQVVVVAGETGSGKTTQLPKICLELGRGVRGMIGHTQPRRLAARTVAARIAEELGAPLGGAVGYQVRFTGQVGDETLVKLMTDGILLAEIQHDRDLLRYDTLLVDEAHERSLNVDFLLGYLAQLLPRRPDLKVVITSATIDPDRFARHFGTAGTPAPVIEVSGRTYPVEVRYRPPDDTGEHDPVQAIVDAVAELRAEAPGDVLVFLSGEREIRDAADALRQAVGRDTEILPLYARLSTAEQHRVFQPHPGRRIVLATNVAETSLTVPGIRYVVDPGTARISRYSHRLKVQRLPIEPVSQASANQRAGRCGRLSDGICIRLYSEEDYLARPAFTDPEILRTNLASVLLQMAALRLGDVAAFPFLDPPDRRAVTDGVRLLEELGAFDPGETDPARRLTPLGRRLARLPVDPRFGRMVLEAERNGCLHEVLVIVAALTIQDPREVPAENKQAAVERHARFADPTSDFLAYLTLWDYLQEQQESLSSSRFRRLCRSEFLHYLRVREWQDLYGQLRQAAGRDVPDAGDLDADRVHQSLLAGLLSHLGLKDGDTSEYLGARGARFAVFPGSALFRKPPRWVMVAELVETSRLWGRIAARIEPEWAEALAGHLVQRSYSEPRWDSTRGQVLAAERVTLYGVPLVVGRTVSYARVDPALCRELFIRHALVEGDWQTRHAFFHTNRALLDDVEELEHRARRRDIVVDDETLFAFYDQRIGPEVVSARHFDSWWKQARRAQPDLLTFDRSMLVNPDAGEVDPGCYPDVWPLDDLRLPLSYTFEPGSPADGVTVDVPLTVLSRVPDDAFDWQVPGLRHELVTALVRSLPKPVRRHVAPAPEFAKAVLARTSPGEEPLLPAMERVLRERTGVAVPRESWGLDRVPGHLRMTVRVVDGDGRTVAEGKDLPALKEQLAGRVRAAVSAAVAEAAGDLERRGLRRWTLGTLPRTVTSSRGGQLVQGYPALVDEGDSVGVRVLDSEDAQRQAMWVGTRRLLLLTIPSPVKPVLGRLDNATKLALGHHPYPTAVALFDDCVACAVDAAMAAHGGPAWDEAGFAALRDAVRVELPEALLEVVTTVGRILSTAREVRARLDGTPAVAAAVRDDVTAQLAALVYPGFVTATGRRRLAELPRYLRAVVRRLEKLSDDPARDRVRMLGVQDLQRRYAQLRDELPPRSRAAADAIRWMIEELRVSYFAQQLGTAHPVSDVRILRAMDDLREPGAAR